MDCDENVKFQINGLVWGEKIILSEVAQPQKNKQGVFSLVCAFMLQILYVCVLVVEYLWKLGNLKVYIEIGDALLKHSIITY